AAGDPSWASVLAEAEVAFYAFPTQEVVGEDNQARVLEFNEQNYRPIRNVWRDPEAAAEARIAYMAFFRDRYREVEELASRGRPD
ncbi:MAG: hypothetical protein HRU13_10650, partial [Phycisphaerales bacterium]|nr:hypothetical protein [Phycisphaerales bacterium]